MLKLPQILGWRPPVRGRHERPAAEAPSVRPEETGEAAVLPEDLEETLEAWVSACSCCWAAVTVRVVPPEI